MVLIFIMVAFLVVLAAGVYLEELKWQDAAAWAVGMAFLGAIFARAGWHWLGFVAVLVLVTSCLVLKVFKRDLWVPPGSGGLGH